MIISGKELKINELKDMAQRSFGEFDSMINMRPSQGNRSRAVESVELRNRIISIVQKKIIR